MSNPLSTDARVIMSATSRLGRVAAASLIGTTLEWYDFAVYNLLAAVVFNVVFFPSFDRMTGTILAFSTYAVGYVARPVGGMLFGHLGDKRGRRVVLVATLILMGTATALMGALPGYVTLGICSPMLLVLLRFVQGAAIGGEWAGAVLLSMEHGAANQRGRNASFTQMGMACGTLLGTGAIASVSLWLSPADFQSWGWRIPLLLSVLLVAFGLWLRHGVEETPVFESLREHRSIVRAPLSEVFTHHWRTLLVAGGARVGSDVVYALVVVFALTYVTTVLHLSRTLALGATMIGATCHALAVPLCGDLSDRIGRRPVYAVGAVLAMGWAFVFFKLMDSSRPVLITAAVAGGMIIHAMMYGPQAAFVTEQFPARVRYTGSSLTFTLSGIVGSGFAPLIIAAIFKSFGSTWVISAYVCGALAVTLLALSVAPETAATPLKA